MDTDAALEACIEHWQENYDNVQESLGEEVRWWSDGVVADNIGNVIMKVGAVHCPLCARYIAENCEGCPVHEDTGHSCYGTPYKLLENKLSYAPHQTVTQEVIDLVKAGLEYSKGLRRPKAGTLATENR